MMRFSLPVSLLLHAGILAWALFSVSARVELKPVQEVPIAVELLTISEKSDLRAGDRTAKTATASQKKDEKQKPEAKDEKKKERVAVLPPKAEEPKKEEPKQEDVKKAEPKKEEPKKEAKAEPDPIADLLKKPDEPRKEEAKTEEPKKKEEPKKETKKPEPPKKAKAEPKKEQKKKKQKEESFEDTVAALLNKVPNPSSASSSNAEADPNAKTKKAAGGENATGQGLTVNERELIGAIIRGKIRDERCWNPPVGSTGADKINVTLKFRLERDGTVDGTPSVLNGDGSVQFTTAAESAVRAILNCSPFDQLASRLGHLYDEGWNTVTVNFRPDQMFGG
jgi:colicin import membrane protein